MAEIIEQSRIPKRTLVDGFKVPAIGLGTFGSDKYNSDQIAEAVYGGIRAGYRMIDCASVYQNENRIGESIERVLKEGIVDRADLFITSKVWNDMLARSPQYREAVQREEPYGSAGFLSGSVSGALAFSQLSCSRL